MTAADDALADPALTADCAACAALCCVVLPLTRSHDFAIDKPAGVPCPHLHADDRCAIHDRLRPSGFPGCAAFDCFGAGQRVVQEVYGGRLGAPEEVTAVLGVLRATQEAVFLLRWAVALPEADPDRSAIDDLHARLVAVADGAPVQVVGTDVAALRARAGDLLHAVSRRRRGGRGAELAGVDLAGGDLRSQDLRAADLRGSLLVGSDLRGCDLDRADLLGADLRGADLRGTDLAGALFLTRPQLASATGDGATRLPAGFERPDGWA